MLAVSAIIKNLINVRYYTTAYITDVSVHARRHPPAPRLSLSYTQSRKYYNLLIDFYVTKMNFFYLLPVKILNVASES